MEQSEFSYFTITPYDMQREGYGSGVGVDADNRITLASTSTVMETGPLATAVGIAFDRTGTLFCIDRTDGLIYYKCPGATEPLRIPCIGGRGVQQCRFRFASGNDSEYSRLWNPDKEDQTSGANRQLLEGENRKTDNSSVFGGIAVSKQFIVVSDTGNRRLQCFFRRSLQLSFIIDAAELRRTHVPGRKDAFSPWDCVIDSFGDVYVIDIASKSLLRISHRGNYLTQEGRNELSDPVSFFLDASDTLYVLDRGNSAVLKRTAGPAGTWSRAAEFGSTFSNGHLPLGVAVDESGTIYVGEHGPVEDHLFHLWSKTGAYTGHFRNPFGGCQRLAKGGGAVIHAECTGSGVVRLNDESSYSTEGHFYSKIYDGGERMFRSPWHRIVADAELPGGTRLGIDYVADDFHHKIGNPREIEESRWRKLFDIHGEDATVPDALLADAQGRYLALRIRLKGDGGSSPKLRRIRIFYPHESYLRYLPAVYQEDPIGRDLTDRFLSLFESFNMDMEEQIASITRLIDPHSTRSDFLPWLATWMGIVRDENWPESRFRELLSHSYTLFKLRGTIEGLKQMITLYTGTSAKIIEHFRYLRPMVLGDEVRLGMSSVVGRRFTSPLVIEETSTIGDFKLIEAMEPPEMPFIIDAYDFTVVVDTSDLTKEQQACLERIIEHEKPAHTRCRLHKTVEGVPRIGRALLGVDTRLAHANQPMRVGETSILGSSAITGTRYPSNGLYGAKSKIGVTTTLH